MPEHAIDRLSEFAAVALSVLDGAARQRIRIGAAAGPEHRDGPRVFCFQLTLREAGVIATKPVVLQRRVVAGVAEDGGPERTVSPFDAQDRHGMIDRAVRVAAVDEAAGGRLAAIHREPGGAGPE